MTGTTICVPSITKQIVADNTALVRPFFAETGNFTDRFVMAYGAIADFFGLMPFMVEFHAMLENKVICRI
jgi:hypothetical protein